MQQIRKLRQSLSPVSSALLLLALATVVFNLGFFWYTLRYPSDGCSVYLDSTGLVVENSPGGSPLQTGDLITHVNGHSLEDGLHVPGHWSDILGPSSQSADYTIIRDGATIEVQVPWERPTIWQALGRIGTLSTIGMAFIGSAAFILLSRTRERASPVVALFFCVEGLNLINNAWVVTGANLALSTMWLAHAVDLLSFGLAISYAFHTLLVFPERKWLARNLPISLYIVHLINLSVALVSLVSLRTSPLLEVRALTYRVYYPLAAIEILVGLAHLAHTYATSRRPGVRNQIRWLIWGVSLGALPWLLLQSLPVAFGSRPILPIEVTSLALALIPIAFVLSVTRRGLLIVDTFVHSSIVHLLLVILLVGAYLILSGVFSWITQYVLGSEGELAASILTVVLISLLTPPLHSLTQRVIDRAFYRRRLDLQELLRRMVTELSTTLKLDDLLEKLTQDIPYRLRVRGAALLLPDAQHGYAPAGPQSEAHGQWYIETDHPLISLLQESTEPLAMSQLLRRSYSGIHSNQIPQSGNLPQENEQALSELVARGWELLIPLRSRGRLVGIYLFGPRESGDLYSREEINLLALLGHQIAATLENTSLYRQVEQHSYSLEELVAERTRELEGAINDLGNERNRLNVILQNMANGLLVTDPYRRVLLINSVFEEMVRRPARELLGYPLEQTLRCLPLSDLISRATTKPGEVFSSNFELGPHVLRASATALRDRSGVVTVLQDITHEVEVDRLKTQFISAVSHELRTPMTSVLGFAKLIRRTFGMSIVPLLPQDEGPRRAADRIGDNLDIIIAEGERLTRLINDVLDISEMEAGNAEWRDEPIDVRALIHQAVEQVQRIADDRGLVINLSLGVADLPPLFADPNRILQVLNNLLSNAIKFTAEGEIRITVSKLDVEETIRGWQAPAESLGSILISIADQGIGISPDKLSHLFQRFYQVTTSALTDKPDGTGLGLTISRQIVAHYGGIIWAESTEGVGSTFSFAIPGLPAPEAS